MKGDLFDRVIAVIGDEDVAGCGIGENRRGAVQSGAPAQNVCEAAGGGIPACQLAYEIGGELGDPDIAVRVDGEITWTLETGAHGVWDSGIGRGQFLHLARVAVNDKEVCTGVNRDATRLLDAVCGASVGVHLRRLPMPEFSDRLGGVVGYKDVPQGVSGDAPRAFPGAGLDRDGRFGVPGAIDVHLASRGGIVTESGDP